MCLPWAASRVCASCPCISRVRVGEHIPAVLGACGPAEGLFASTILTTLDSVDRPQTLLQNDKLQEAVEPLARPCPPCSKRVPMTYHIFDLAVPIAEDDGIGGIAHRQHHCKGDAHGDWDQSVEWINVQRFRLGEERIHRNISVEMQLAFLGLNFTNML